jgi:hypothetical protein
MAVEKNQMQDCFEKILAPFDLEPTRRLMPHPVQFKTNIFKTISIYFVTYFETKTPLLYIELGRNICTRTNLFASHQTRALPSFLNNPNAWSSF